MRIRSLAVLTVLTLTAGVLGMTPASAAQTLVVDDDGQGAPGDCDSTAMAFDSIQEAVNAATDGDTIQVCPGTYEESVMIDKTLEILGAKAGSDARRRTVTLADESIVVRPTEGETQHFGFYVAAPNVVISGFYFTGWDVAIDSGGFNEEPPEEPSAAAGLRILDSIFYDNFRGVTIFSNNSLARRNLFDSNFVGIEMLAGSKALFVSNDFVYNEVGVLVGSGLLVSASSFNGGYYGPGPIEDLRVLRNNFSAGGENGLEEHSTAIEATNTTGLRILENTISHVGTGIWLIAENEATTIERNSVDEAAFAALLLGFGRFVNLVVYEQSEYSSANSAVTVRTNSLTNSGYGIRIEEDSLDGSMLVRRNAIVGNGLEEPGNGGIDNESGTQVDAAENWWGDPSGPSDWSIGTGDSVSEQVRFFPWALDPAFSAFAQCTNAFTSGPDTVVGTAASEILCGGGGQDDLDGRGGKDLILGDTGSDTMRGGAGDDAILGGQGNDSLSGNAGFDSLQGQGGTDHCVVGVHGGQIATCETGDAPPPQPE